MPTLNVSTLSSEEKIAEAIRRSLRLLPHDIAMQLEAMLSPASLAVMCAAIVAWAVSHAFGVGEVADLALLGIGLGFCGWGIFDGLRDLGRFASSAIHARSEQDLDTAAGYFANAVVEVGVNTIMAILLRKPIGSFRELGGVKKLNFRPNLLRVEDPLPPPGVKPVVQLGKLDPGVNGITSWYGDITISRKLRPEVHPEEYKVTLDHEMVHSFFSPKMSMLRNVRARLVMSGYSRSALLKYLEEAMAETYAQVRARGIHGVITGIRFPLKDELYISIAEWNVVKGVFLGVIVVEGHIMHVSLTHPQPTQPPKHR